MTKTVDGNVLYQAVISGASEVRKAKNFLNQINVFPVADGDTGNNLDAMMQYIIDEATVMDTPKETMESIADAALMGAKGNSGIIFAEYINGMSLEIVAEPKLPISNLLTTMEKAVPYAYNAINNPVNGTMLTVMSDWAHNLKINMDTSKWDKLLDSAFVSVEKALAETTQFNPFLKKSNVVDSGAKGFVCFLNGFITYLKTGEPVELPDANSQVVRLDHEDKPFSSVQPIEYRYCTEVLINSNIKESESIKEQLNSLGDSLIVAGNDRKTRMHIHTNDPMSVTEILHGYGNIMQQKIDDMIKEYQVFHERKYPIALLVDSVADIPEEIINDYQIQVIPLQILIDDSIFLDGLSIDADRYYQISENLDKPASSSLQSAKHIEKSLTFLKTHYDSVIVMSVSSGISGTYTAFSKAIQSLSKDGYPISLVDTKLNSGAQGLVTYYAAKLIAEGYSHQDIVKAVESACQRSYIYVSLASLKPIIRSGRVNKKLGAFLELINLKPIVSLDKTGKGSLEDKSFSINGSEKKMLKKLALAHEKRGIMSYNVVHGRGEDRVERIVEQCIEITGTEPEYVTEVSTSVAVNAGENNVAVSFVTK